MSGGRHARLYASARGAQWLTVDSGGIIGKLEGVRRVPMHVPYVYTSTGATATWIGQSRGIAVSTLGLTGGTLAALKLATIIVVSNTLLEAMDPRAETLIKDAMILAIRRASDFGFIDPGVAGTAGVTPASITYGVSGLTSSGATVVALSDDVAELLEGFRGNLATSAWIMGSAVAAKIILLTGGAGLGLGLGLSGGTFMGLPAIVSSSSETSSSGGALVLVDAAQVAIADEGISVSRSGDATVEMSDAPAGRSDTPTAASVNLTSMMQSDTTAFRAIRRINWFASPGAVAVLTMTW